MKQTEFSHTVNEIIQIVINNTRIQIDGGEVDLKHNFREIENKLKELFKEMGEKLED